ncbi:carbohydrate-binding domain-containing protein [Enterocloster sp.]|uniref:carbohydrate-binding domain-containing protein n=1 Tax=Enterocloster sp. TaxID=2719315 RepID=UPI003AF6926C
MRKKQIAGIFITGIILLSGCARSSTEPGSVQSADETRTAETDPTNESMETGENSEKTTSFEIDTSDMFSDSDRNVEYNEAESTIIQLSDEGSFCDTDTVVIDQNTVTITDEGTYLLSGSLSDGMLIVNAETTDEVHLVFNQAAISNQDSAAVYIASADKVFLTLADGTENAVSNGGVYADIDEDTIDGAIFSKADLSFNGTGKLIVTAAAGHGIVSKADLIFADGSYEISAAEHGIEGKDSVRIAEGTYEILSGKDGIHSENDEDETLGFIYLKDGIFKIQSQGDGISAGNWLLAENGTYEITTGQGGVSAEEKNSLEQHKQEEQEKSAKGIKAGAQMLLKEGTYCLDTEDDLIHSNGDVFITGGDYTLSSRDDGIHADDGAAISGGSIKISESYEGIEGLTIDITGGQIDITASDDGVNAAGGRDGSSMEKGQDPFVSMEGAYISISGGSLRINASGDGISSLDYNGKAVVTGGIFASSGASGMAQNFDPSSTQGIIMVTLNPQEAGTQIALKNSDGTELLSWKAEKEYSSVLISSPDIRQGESYSLTAGTEEKTITMDSLVYGTDIPENGKAPVGSEIPKGGRGPENGEVPTGGRAPMEREPAENGKRPGEMDNKPGMGEKTDNENKKEIQ